MKVLAEITSYTELTAALRARADELKFSGKSLDAISGLADGYFQKLIGPIPQRTLGPGMLDAVLGALCVKLAVIHDAEALEELRRRIASPIPGRALDGVVERDDTRVRKPPKVITYTTITYHKMAKKGGKARAQKLSAQQRQAIARLGGQACRDKDKLRPEQRREITSKAAQAKWARIRAKQKEIEANPIEGDLEQLERKIRS